MKTCILALSILMLIASCKSGTKAPEANVPLQSVQLNTTDEYSRFIAPDSGNKMISSYLTSINATQNDSDLFSVILVADSLRAYLQDPSVKNIKIMFAHSLEYINNGDQGVPAGYRHDALSFVIAGYDASGDYVYHNGKVLERSMPCPTNCVISGTASSNLLTIE